MKNQVERWAADCQTTSQWLSSAMEQSWRITGALVQFDELIDLLGERHRIIGSDWQAAGMNALIARFLGRSLEVLEQIDFSPPAIRDDLAGLRRSPGYLYAASELLDAAADLYARSAILVHENERRWRVFGERIGGLIARSQQ